MSDLVNRLRAPLEIQYAVPIPVGEVLQRAADERGEAAGLIESMTIALLAAKALCDNINEFGHVTDCVFLDAADEAVNAALRKARGEAE